MRLLPTRLGAGIAAVAMATTAVSASANTYPCFDEDAVQSARIHDLRVMLMVNALKCRELAPSTLHSYGQLVEARYDEFAEHAEFVEASLVDRHGPRMGRAAFDDYETRIGNYHSGVRPSRELCANTAAFINLAGKADHADLETLSRLMTNRDIAVCAAPRSDAFEMSATYDARPAQRLPKTSEVVPPRQGHTAQAPQMVDGIPTYDAPGSGVDTAPEPIEEAVLLVEAEAAATPDAGAGPDRFEQAIAALDAAADALRDLRAEDAATQ